MGVFFKDITLDQKIIQRQQDIISVASHELKTPLTSIVMYSQLLQKYLNKKSDEKANTLMNFLIDQINTLSNLISYLFDTSMIQTGKMKLKKEVIDINLLLTELVMNAQKLAITQKIFLQSNIQRKILVDKVRITQVIVNLLNNAIKYSPGKKEIIVKAIENKEALTVSVQDFGVGILKTKQKEIFTRLYRTDLGEKTAEGLGLGLFIATSIIKAHKGKLWVESVKGKGSTFFFTIPF